MTEPTRTEKLRNEVAALYTADGLTLTNKKVQAAFPTELADRIHWAFNNRHMRVYVFPENMK